MTDKNNAPTWRGTVAKVGGLLAGGGVGVAVAAAVYGIERAVALVHPKLGEFVGRVAPLVASSMAVKAVNHVQPLAQKEIESALERLDENRGIVIDEVKPN